jgi:hypothetical protein
VAKSTVNNVTKPTHPRSSSTSDISHSLTAKGVHDSNLDEETSRNTRAKDSITKPVSLKAVEAVAPFDFKHPLDARTNAAPPKRDTSPYKCGGKPLPPYTANISDITKGESSDDGKSSQQFVSKPQESPKSRSGNIFLSDVAN